MKTWTPLVGRASNPKNSFVIFIQKIFFQGKSKPSIGSPYWNNITSDVSDIRECRLRSQILGGYIRSFLESKELKRRMVKLEDFFYIL